MSISLLSEFAMKHSLCASATSLCTFSGSVPAATVMRGRSRIAVMRIGLTSSGMSASASSS